MNELITLLKNARLEGGERGKAALESALLLAVELVEENDLLRREAARLEQILRDVRERDARKNCLCRGLGR